MSDIPKELHYTDTHEWIRQEENGICAVGITEHAQNMLGGFVFIELPEQDVELNVGDECGVVESVKAASDVYTPLSGKIIEVNAKLEKSPELVNDDPYGDGWLYRIKLSKPEELEKLLTAQDYMEKIAKEEE